MNKARGKITNEKAFLKVAINNEMKDKDKKAKSRRKLIVIRIKRQKEENLCRNKSMWKISKCIEYIRKINTGRRLQ